MGEIKERRIVTRPFRKQYCASRVSNFVQLSSVNRRKVIILWLGPRNTSTQERYVLNDQEGLMKKTKKRRETRSGVQQPSIAGPH